jgi:hypothetical protein
MAFFNSIPQSLSVFNWAAGALAAASNERLFYHGIFNCQTDRSGFYDRLSGQASPASLAQFKTRCPALSQPQR